MDGLFQLYIARVSREADLVCYWFEKARAMIADARLGRAGLPATQAIRGGANRHVLERIKEIGDIFVAWSDRDWVLDGETVHVSMVGFDNGTEQERTLNGASVQRINPDLTATVDLTIAKTLSENADLAFIGDTKVGPFEIAAKTARTMLADTGNPNNRPNTDVVRPWVNGLDITRRPRNMWIIDFGTDMSQEEAAQYEAPFEHVLTTVKPMRLRNRRTVYRERWWIHTEARPSMRQAIAPLGRYIVTPRVTKHRLFAWPSPEVLPDSATIAIARDDDYFFGVLHSRPHELWSRRKGTQLREQKSGCRYTPTTTFGMFPFPWPPGHEHKDDPRVVAVAEAAREPVRKRGNWLNPEDASEKELRKRTLTNLYNSRPTWLQLAHSKLDQAVFDAYGWPHELTDEEVLTRLLALNLERAKAQEP